VKCFRWTAAALLAVLAGTACGTRLERGDIEYGAFGAVSGRPGAVVSGAGSEPSSGAPSAVDTATDPAAPASGGTADAGATAASAGTAAGAGAGGGVKAAAVGKMRAAGGNAPATPTGGSAAASPSAPGAASTSGAASSTSRAEAGTAAVGDRSPVVVGNVGTYSGPVGSSAAPAQTALLMWAKWVNGQGGVNGHPIKVITADDQNDPTRNLSLVKDMVENQRVVAFVANMVTLTYNGSLTYLEEKNVPVLGGDVTDHVWNTSPVLFPQNAGIHKTIAGMARLAKQAGGTKFGVLYCAEAKICETGYQQLFPNGEVKRAGMEPVYAAKISITQPDYTAECLQAKNKGVDVVAVGADAATLGRVVSSCARQGFRPRYTAVSITIAASLAENPALEGFTGSLPSFPWTVTGSPGVDEYHQAVAQLAPKLAPGVAASQAWTAGKLFEAAVRKITGPVTTAGLFGALWSMKGETLGGLTSPLTFAKGQPAPEGNCIFPMRIEGGKWVAPSGLQQTCV
jgi:branched-chain amino acid transport system substrate-binding protein